MLLELRSVSKRFGGTIAVDAFDWDVAESEVHCLIGENGSGKSTLIKIVSGVYQPEVGGSFHFDGKRVEKLDPGQAKSLGIEVIFQDLSLFPNLTVYENIASDFHGRGPFSLVQRSRMRAIAKATLERVGAHLSLDAIVGTLSVSQRQLVAICRSLSKNARLLFMDEPTASLTRAEVAHLFAVVRRLKQQGVAIVFVSHRLNEILEIADRVTVIRDARKVASCPASELDELRLAELMTGEKIADKIMASGKQGTQPVMQIEGLGREGEFANLDLTIHKGEVLGIIGLLGAGRTELALTLFGMNKPDSGVIRLDGKPAQFGSVREAIEKGVAYVSEDRLALGLHLDQPIFENVALGILDRLKNRFGRAGQNRRREVGRVWLDKLGIKAGSVEDPVLTLSGGNQQRVVLSKWLATDPKVLILDSPTIGVDIRNKRAIYQIIHDLAQDGVSIILISDELSEVYFNADRVLHMAEGRIIGSYLPQKTSRAEMAETIYA